MLRVMLTEPAFLTAATAVYGAMARIIELHDGGDTTCSIEAISMQLDSNHSVHRLQRSVLHSMKHDGVAYKLSMFSCARARWSAHRSTPTQTGC